jgi:hypothetical protein
MLVTVFTLGFPGEVVDHFTGESNVRHSIKYDSVGDVIANTHDLPIQAGLYLIDILAFPKSDRHHGRANVNQHRPCKTACQLLDDIGVSLSYPPPHHSHVLINLFSGNLQLLLTVACHLHS